MGAQGAARGWARPLGEAAPGDVVEKPTQAGAAGGEPAGARPPLHHLPLLSPHLEEQAKVGIRDGGPGHLPEPDHLPEP